MRIKVDDSIISETIEYYDRKDVNDFISNNNGVFGSINTNNRPAFKSVLELDNYSKGTHSITIELLDFDNNIINFEKYEVNFLSQKNGWIYENGKRYFYDKYGNVIGNETSKKIIDVSSWQGNINWDAVANNSDVDGVILRLGYSWDGEDEQFARNISELNRLNIPYGVYLYTYASNSLEAVKEAEFTISLLKKYDAKLAYPIFYDVENWAYLDGSKCAPSDTGTWASIITSYINTMNMNGYQNVNVYSYRYLLETRLNHPDILKYTSWVAAYTNELGWQNPYYSGSFGWQYTSSESILGIIGNTDVSCWFSI